LSAVKTLTRDVMHMNSTNRNQRERERERERETHTALVLSVATNQIGVPLVKPSMKDSTVRVQGRGKSRRAGKTFSFDRVTSTFLFMQRNRVAAKSCCFNGTRRSTFQRSCQCSVAKNSVHAEIHETLFATSSPLESFIDLSYRSPWSVRITDDAKNEWTLKVLQNESPYSF